MKDKYKKKYKMTKNEFSVFINPRGPWEINIYDSVSIGQLMGTPLDLFTTCSGNEFYFCDEINIIGGMDRGRIGHSSNSKRSILKIDHFVVKHEDNQTSLQLESRYPYHHILDYNDIPSPIWNVLSPQKRDKIIKLYEE